MLQREHRKRRFAVIARPPRIPATRIPALRRLYATCERAIRAHRPKSLRITDFSVQSTHVHLLVEAADRRALSRGIHGFEVRLARALNRQLDRKGQVFADRWHGHALRSPREVRNALVYVLMNAKKHGQTLSNGIDPCSSAPWFSGFVERVEGAIARGKGVVLGDHRREGRRWRRGEGWPAPRGAVLLLLRDSCATIDLRDGRSKGYNALTEGAVRWSRSRRRRLSRWAVADVLPPAIFGEPT